MMWEHSMPGMMPGPGPAMPMSDWQDYNDQDDSDETEQDDDSHNDQMMLEVDSDEAEEQVLDSAETNDLLAEARAAYEDSDTGEPLSQAVAEIANGIWNKGRNPKMLKELANKHRRPSNTQIHKVDLNEEVSSTMPSYARARDLRMWAIQANIAKASIPAFWVVDALHSKSSKISRQEQVNLAIDTCSILASANSSINQLRRELVKPSVQKKHQVLCYKPPPSQTKFLFGDNLPERVKAANTASSLLSSRSANRGGAAWTRIGTIPMSPMATQVTRPTDTMAMGSMATANPKTGSDGALAEENLF